MSSTITAGHATAPLMLATLVWRFDSLVADPVPAMSLLLALTAAYQVVSAVASLPAAGSPAAKTAPRKPRPGERNKSGGGGGGGSESGGPNIAVTTFLAAILTAFAVPALHVALVLLGAPFLTQAGHTALCAAHLAVLALFPLFYTLGVDAPAWALRAGLAAPLDETYGGALGAVLGAWLGAVPIPLDWDREWQKWPVTILCGMYAGYVAGRALGAAFHGRKLGIMA